LIFEEAQEIAELDDLLMPIIKLKKNRKTKDFDLSGVRRSARFKKNLFKNDFYERTFFLEF
jgi:hypothetical protein